MITKYPRIATKSRMTKPLNTEEHKAQVEVVDWLDFIATRRWPHFAILDGWALDDSAYSIRRPQYRIPFFAIPNGGKRHMKTAKALKEEGQRSGVPDLMIPIARHGFHGLFIEMKKPYVKGKSRGRKTKAQIQWINALSQSGYKCVVCEGATEAIETLTDYFNAAKG